MLDAETKRRIDTARDILVGKVPDPKSQVEQITIALIYKFMDDMDAISEELGGERSFFAGEFGRYSWSKLMQPGLGGHEMLGLYAEAIVRMDQNAGIPQLFRDIFSNAFLPYRDPETLRVFLKVIDGFTYDNSERLGDAFEYLLSVMDSQGDAGQFRTPRHIIDFVVSIVDPKKDDVVLDPACGTAGFLISSYKHILEANTDADGNSTLTPDDRERLAKNLMGYDISPDMVRLSLVNMYLHGLVDPHIYEYDTLTSEERWNEFADVILANPPFMSPKGGIRPHNRFSVQSKRSEVLFVDYMAEHLNAGGRAGIIVPEGIIFQSQNAYKELRKNLVEECLVAVVSLPAGVFNPYSGVKTSILLLDKALARKTDRIAFFKVENDGFDLGAQRRPIDKNDLPHARAEIAAYMQRLRAGEARRDIQLAPVALAAESRGEYAAGDTQPGNGLIVEKERVVADGEYTLSGERYRETHTRTSAYPMTPLDEICELVRGVTYRKGDEVRERGLQVLRANNINRDTHSLNLTEIKNVSRALKFPDAKKLKRHDILICLASGSQSHIGKVALSLNDTEYYFGGFMGAVRANSSLVDPHFLYFQLRQTNFNDFLRQQISGANINNLSAKLLYRFQIPLPPLEVQKEIVAEIEGYQKVIDGARAVVENYRPHIHVDPEWPMVELAEVCETTSGGTPLKSNSEYYHKGTIPWLRSGEIAQGKIEKAKSFITKEGLENSSAKIFPQNTILVAMYGATAGQVGILRFEASTNQAICGIIAKERVIPEFLYHLLKSKTDEMVSLSLGGAQPNISQKILRNLVIPLPPLKIQEQIFGQIEAELVLVEASRELIERFEKKIQVAIARVWKNKD